MSQSPSGMAHFLSYATYHQWSSSLSHLSYGGAEWGGGGRGNLEYVCVVSIF